ncbi:hypothetical protein AB0M11_01780 [Streptomyces sp. NPDC051987]|uniref:hypothetical protein n=1 Tax=Streptomyces sp. NPDC051987 TaxID=3155808 RepID=UPI00343280B9
MAKGASDDLSATLLKHAGFRQIEDWYGRRHRLATTTPQAERVAIASHAAEMLRAARYSVDLDPDLDDEAHALADRFGFAAEFVSAAQAELVRAGRRIEPCQRLAASGLADQSLTRLHEHATSVFLLADEGIVVRVSPVSQRPLLDTAR